MGTETFTQATTRLKEVGSVVSRDAWGAEAYIELYIPPPLRVKSVAGDGTISYVEEAVPESEWYINLNTTKVTIDSPSIYVGITRYYPSWEDMVATDWGTDTPSA